MFMCSAASSNQQARSTLRRRLPFLRPLLLTIPYPHSCHSFQQLLLQRLSIHSLGSNLCKKWFLDFEYEYGLAAIPRGNGFPLSTDFTTPHTY